jgi:hypothetical protein
MPTALLLLLASTDPSDLMVHSSTGPPGSQGLGPCQVDRTSLCNGSRDGQQSSCSPLFGLLCSGMLASCSPFHGGASGLCLPFCGGALDSNSCIHLPFCGSTSGLWPPCGSVLTSSLALPYAQRTSTSSLVVVATSALLVGSMPVVLSARAGIVPTTDSAFPHLCTSMLEGLRSLTYGSRPKRVIDHKYVAQC